MASQRINIPVIDLFAGPGGLGEGFSAYNGQLKFNVNLSIEKDPPAHKTLELRSFVRQFPRGELPDEYYAYVRDKTISKEDLYRAYPEQAEKAKSIAWLAELGKEPYENLLKRIGDALDNAQHWVLLGGPPCQAYSLMGRARMQKKKDFAKDHRHTLYREYLKILAAFQPTVFVMENVKGILSSQHREEAIFGKILSDMRDPWSALSPEDIQQLPKPSELHQYRIYSFSTPASVWDEALSPEDYVIESEQYALPQKRHRVILLGIRADFDMVPPVLEKAHGTVTVRDIIGNMPKLRSRLSKGDVGAYKWRAAVRRAGDECTANNMTRFRGLATVIRANLKDISDGYEFGGHFVPSRAKPRRLSDWLYDEKLGGVLQHEARGHMETDLHRYVFASSFAQMYKRSPKLDEFPEGLFPNHKNAVTEDNGKVANFSDRFRVQLWDDAATTITSHIAKDGHYFIHPDPLQCRSLTVREAARLQTFPDNYYFEGNRTDQYRQIGNAVPPFLASQLSDVVAEIVSCRLAADQSKHGKKSRRRVIGG